MEEKTEQRSGFSSLHNRLLYTFCLNPSHDSLDIVRFYIYGFSGILMRAADKVRGVETKTLKSREDNIGFLSDLDIS